ncbi:MAG: MerR family transcriptional regulator [Streptosporangiales bacterium]|nr:MerR family transcriptional regulator [Streptosporangiales bacterium]
MQIGEVAERTGLSLRTIRYYEEVGLVAPSSRTQGGFRLYTEQDVERLLVIKRMKPLEFSLGEMRELLSTLDQLADLDDDKQPRERDTLLARLSMYRQAADARCEALRAQLGNAEEFAEGLKRELTRRQRSAGRR